MYIQHYRKSGKRKKNLFLLFLHFSFSVQQTHTHTHVSYTHSRVKHPSYMNILLFYRQCCCFCYKPFLLYIFYSYTLCYMSFLGAMTTETLTAHNPKTTILYRHKCTQYATSTTYYEYHHHHHHSFALAESF